MKIPEGIMGQKKVRCSGCSTVILIDPDPTSPNGVMISYPRKKDKKHELTEGQKRFILYTLFGGFVIFFGYIIWTSIREPTDKAAIEGMVTFDGVPMESGTIIFTSQDGKNNKSSATISRGKYSISARNGPMIGSNRVTIEFREKTGKKVPDPNKPGEDMDEILTASQFNASARTITVLAEKNPAFNFDVLSKQP